MKYAWIIDVSHIDFENSKDFTPITGPSDITPEQEAHLIFATGQKFKMYDDDGELYYSGRIIGNYSGFEPLDDFGTPNAGCTEIKLLNSKTNKWETL